MNEVRPTAEANVLGVLLQLLATDLAAAIRAGDQDCFELCRSFGDVAHASLELSSSLRTQFNALALEEVAERIAQSVSESIIGLQYQDRLAQRIGLIQTALERLASMTSAKPGRSLGGELLEIEIAYRLEQRRLYVEDIEHTVGGDLCTTDAHVELF